MITQPKSLLLQGLQFAQMVAFCIKGTGPQWAAGAAGLSALISILWPSAARPEPISAAQLQLELAKLQASLSAVVWTGFQSVYQADLDSAIAEWSDVFDDMAAGKLDVDVSTPTGQVNASAWKSFANKALNYGTWTSTNPLPQVWNWASDQAVLQQKNVRPEVTRLQLFPFYSAAANCFLVWSQLGLFYQYIEIKQKVAAAVKAGNANATKGEPKVPNDNPQSPYFVAQQQALDLFIAYVDGGSATVQDAQGNSSVVKLPGVLPIVRDGQTALAAAVSTVKASAGYNGIKPRLSDDGLSFVYTDPDTQRPVNLFNATTMQEAQQQCDQLKRMLLAKAIAAVEDDHCMNVLSNVELQAIEDTLAEWKKARSDLATLARRHQN